MYIVFVGLFIDLFILESESRLEVLEINHLKWEKGKK